VSGVVLLDLFNTLVDDGGGAARDDVTRRMAGVLGVDPDAFTGLFHRRWRARLTGGYGPLAEMVRAFAVELGGAPDDAAVERAVRLRTGLASALLGGAPAGTLATLDALRAKGVRLAVVSNCTVEVAQVWPASPLGARFDATAFSCELGVGKPDPAIYRHAAQALGVTPADCLYVGDGADRELAGALEAGASVLRTTEFADSDPGWPGPRIGALSQLLDVIGRRG
jgi:putative hydrolase of the HAD superfamily